MDIADFILTSRRYHRSNLLGEIHLYGDLWPVYVSLFVLLLAIVFVDLRQKLIPHWITVPGIAAALFLVAAYRYIVPLNSVAGLLFGVLFCKMGNWKLHRDGRGEGIGGGAIMMVGMIGCFFGVVGLFYSFGMAAVAVMVHSHISRSVVKSRAVEFGPYLALATTVYTLVFF